MCLQIPVPNRHPLQIPVRRHNPSRIMHRPLDHAAGIGKPTDRVALLGQQQTIVPDGACAIDARNIHHWRVIIVACPHAHHIIGSIANRPVITEFLGGACLDGGRTNGAWIALVALRLRIAVQVERAALAELESARGVVAQDIRSDKCYLLADNSFPYGHKMVDQAALRIGYRINGMRGNAHPAIGKHSKGRGLIQ